MAERQLVVRLIGDDRSLERTFTRSSRGAKNFGNDINRASRGAISAAVSFRGLGRALAFGSTSFLGGAGIVFGIKSTIQAAEESQRVLAQTANAVQRSGLSWQKYGKQIQGAALAQSNLAGFDDERLLQTFSALIRRTGDVTQALKLNTLAADVARGANIGLEAAAKLVLRASVGQARGLSIIGVQAKKGANGLQLLDQLQKKFAGSAERYGRTASGAQDRFRVAIDNTQELLGSAAIPQITHYLNIGAAWLSQTKNQQRIQHDFADAIRVVRDTVKDFSAVVGPVVRALGGLKSTLELLVTLKVASSLAGIARGIGLIGTNATRAKGDVTVLQGALTRLKGLGPIAVVIALSIIPKSSRGKTALDNAGLGFLSGLPILGGLTTQSAELGDKIRGALGLSTTKSTGAKFGSQAKIEARLAELRAKPKQNAVEIKALTDLLRKMDKQAAGVADPFNLKGPLGKLSGVTTPTRKGVSASQRNTFFDNAISRILSRGGLRDLQGQLAAIQKASALISARLKVTKDITRKLNLEDQLLDLGSQAKDIRGQISQIASDRAQAQREKLKAQRDRLAEAVSIRLAQRTARQFRELGLNTLGEERTPGVAGLRKRLQQLAGNIAGTNLDTPKLQSQLARFRKVLSEGLVPKDVRAKIAQMMDDIASELKNSGARNLTKFRHVNSNVVLAGLGLTPEQLRVLRGRISQIGAGGTVPGARSLAFSGAGANNPVVVHTSVSLDGKVVARNTTKHQAKDSKRRTASRRGTYAGHH